VSLPRRLAINLLTTAVLFALCEAGARIYLAVHDGKIQDARAALYPPNAFLRAIETKQDYRFINLYTLDPTRAPQPEYDVDSMGFRMDSRKLDFAGPYSGHRIWMLGGSTTLGLGVRAPETIPSLLNDRLEKESDWRVYNLGQAGFTSTQELLLLVELLEAGHRPDAILCYDGINEVPFEGEMDAVGAPGWEKRTPKAALVRDVQDGETVSSLVPLAIVRAFKIDDFMRRALKRGAATHEIPGSNWEVVARRHLESLALIKAIADSKSIPSVFFFQPIMEYEQHYAIRAYSPYEKEKLVGWMDSNEHQRRDALYLPSMEQRRTQLGLTDIHDVFRGHDGETLYADPRHPNGAGNAIIAARIYESLKPVLGRSEHQGTAP
jgi:lysophospholipase L1-like esterase